MAKILLPDLDAQGAAEAVAGHVGKHELSRFIAGELTPQRRAEIAALLAADAALKGRHDALVAEEHAADAALKLEVPLERFLADHAERTTSPLARILKSVRLQAGLGVLVAGAAAVLFMVRAPIDDGDHDPNRTKGGARVGFFVKDSHAAHAGKDGEQLGAGDQIQFAVRDDDARAAMVLVGVDGRGAVTVYAAEQIDRERAKGDPKPRVLPDSIVLDDSTGAERFFVVYGDGTAAELKTTVEAAAHKLADAHSDLSTAESLPLPKGFVQSSVHIVKVAR